MPEEKTDDKATQSAASVQVTASSSSSTDPWSKLGDRITSLDAGARTTRMQAALDGRTRERTLEDQQIRAHLIELQTRLVASCTSGDLKTTFAAFQAEEASSLKRDRDLLQQLLDVAGTDGRATIWKAGDVDAILAQPRQTMIARSNNPLPNWTSSETDENKRVEAQRLLLSLNFAAEAAAIQSKAAVARLANVIYQLDASAETASATVVTAFQEVDDKLLSEQAKKYDTIVGACRQIPGSQWMVMVAGGSVASFLGTLGGTTGQGDPMSPPDSSTSSAQQTGQMGGQMGGMSGGQMGGGQMGGGQMGGQMGGMSGGQMGGNQMGGQMGGMGGGQMGGGQMGGNQMGGNQMGGSQMGGSQMGGSQMGGNQMGGNQMGGGGGQMGGGGGQMGGSQMGGGGGGGR